MEGERANRGLMIISADGFTLKSQCQQTNSSLFVPYISHRTKWEKLYNINTTFFVVIISLFGSGYVLILQGEI